jgi:hypothetical protein
MAHYGIRMDPDGVRYFINGVGVSEDFYKRHQDENLGDVGVLRITSHASEFERELSAESGYVKYDNNALASWGGTKTIPVGDAQEVDHDAGLGFYADKLRGMSWIKGELVETPAHPMCAAMSQPVDPFYQAVTLLMRGEARAAAKRCLADDLATRDFFERGPKPAEVPERAPERAKPPLAGFDVVHEGRWHL